MAGGIDDDEVGILVVVDAVALGLAEEQRAAFRVVLRQQPVLGYHGLGQAPRQRQLADHRREDFLLVEQGEVLREGHAEVRADVLHCPPAKQNRRHQCQQAGQQKRHYRFPSQPPSCRHGFPRRFPSPACPGCCFAKRNCAVGTLCRQMHWMSKCHYFGAMLSTLF
ncbi:hypothetical protein D3C80_1586570 [compost metagenome]